MRSWKRLAVLAATVVMPLGAVPARADSQWRTITAQEAYACVRQDTIAKLADLIVSGDDQASLSYASKQMANGACTSIAKGTQVHIDKEGEHNVTACVRPRGQSDCLWVLVPEAFGQ
jgi:hypothetical protein